MLSYFVNKNELYLLSSKIAIIMAVKLKKIFSFLIVISLLTPSIVKIEHHHVHFICNAKGEKHFHTYSEECVVCNFEFSIFLSEKTPVASVKAIQIDSYSNCYNCFHFLNFSKYSFLLRAPPVFINVA